MWRIKIYFKFIIWLLKKPLKVPLTMLAYIHLYMNEWKDNCRNDVGISLLMFLLMITCNVVTGLVMTLALHSDDVTREMLKDSVIRGFYISCGFYAFAILMAAYEAFIEEYEQSFTRLKE